MNNMYQAKVEQTEKYSDSQGSHVVCRGKVVFIGEHCHETIIISETEDFELTPAWTFDYQTGELMQIKYGGDKYCKKVLALPEHFSDKHLQAIVDGKIKNGDEVLVKCAKYKNYVGPKKENYTDIFTRVHLDQQNHITLFPVKQSLEKASENYAYDSNESYNTPVKFYRDQLQHKSIRDFKAGAEWAKKNNY